MAFMLLAGYSSRTAVKKYKIGKMSNKTPIAKKLQKQLLYLLQINLIKEN